MNLRTGAGTDTGRQRASNEDALLYLPEAGIFAVIDGVGGHAGGEVAAAVAREVVSRRLAHATETPEVRLREAVTNANNTIYWRSREDAGLAGMSCVLTLALVEGSRLYAAHVGDTRLYKIRAHKIEKLTRDHSFVGLLEDREALSEYEAMHHPRRNEILRDVGSELHEPDDEQFIDIVEAAFEPDAAFLLCSDGLTDLVPSRDLQRVVYANAGQPQAAADALIEAANEAGGTDNVTVVVLEGPRFGQADAPATPSHNAASTRADAGDAGAHAPLARAPDAPAQQHASARNVLPNLAAADRRPTPGRTAAAPRSPWRYYFYGLATALALLAATYLVWRFLPAGFTLRLPQAAPADPGGATASASTLGGLLAGASPGDTVTVPPGVYTETLRLRDGVVLRSAQPGGARIVPPTGDSVAVRAENVTGAALIGFYIGPDTAAAGGGSFAVGVLVRNAQVRLEALTVTGTTRAGVDAEADATSEVVLQASEISYNAGAGVIARGAAGQIRILGNRIGSNGGAGVELRLDADTTKARLRRSNTFPAGDAANRGGDVRVVIQQQRTP